MSRRLFSQSFRKHWYAPEALPLVGIVGTAVTYATILGFHNLSRNNDIDIKTHKIFGVKRNHSVFDRDSTCPHLISNPPKVKSPLDNPEVVYQSSSHNIFAEGPISINN